jgi:hypothetical protein
VTPFAPATVRIEFIDGLLPSDDLLREPDPAVRADVGRSRNPACLHSIKRGAADRDDVQDLLFVQHAARPGHIFIPVGLFSPLLSHWRLPQSEYPVSGPASEARSRRETARLLPGSDFLARPARPNWTNE